MNYFKKHKRKWRGVFPDDSRIEMQKGALKSCVKELQNVKLFNSNLEVVDDAFEHLVNNIKRVIWANTLPLDMLLICVLKC